MGIILPYSEKLNIAPLNRIFDNKSECYKLFWFQAILTCVAAGKTDIRYEELIDEMIADAWYMVSEYHLNLGPNDTLEKTVHRVREISGLKPAEKKAKVLEYLSYCGNHDDEAVRGAFEKCAREHLNSDGVRSTLYVDGLDEAAFTLRLDHVVRPVYDAARNCGFAVWKV